MPESASDPSSADTSVSYRRPSSALDEDGRVAPMELTRWLHAKVPDLQERWSHEIRARGLGRDPVIARVLELFVVQLVYLLPFLLGPYRDQIKGLWDRAAALFGSVAAKRGLAAGEAIEELHMLRELVIRDLYRDPPMGGGVPLSLREILRLNRALDRAVTHASVGHTDAMFFQFFEGDGVAGILSGDDVAAEAEAQLVAIGDEVREILSHAATRSPSVGRGN
jgi:hypothetical protein